MIWGTVLLFVLLITLIYLYLAMAISSFYGVPFVPTKKKLVSDIFKHIRLSPADTVVDLGCGDGTVLFAVHKQYHSNTVGYEINILLHWWNRLRARKSMQFFRKSMYEVSLSDASVVYLFLFPEAIERLIPQLEGAKMIISHGFRIKKMRQYEWCIRNTRPFKTYYYQLP